MVEPAVKTKRWTCPSCSRLRTAPYCAQCGEEPLRPRDLTSRDFATKAFEGFTSIDGRLLRSFRLLLTRPGALTVAYVRGERRAYLGPLPLFLIVNALFFGMQSLTHTSIFASPLASHIALQDWSELARQLLVEHLVSHHTTLAAYSPLFDRAATLNAKALIILMALAFTPFLALLFRARHRPVGAHLVFALHLYTFVLLLFCGSLVMVEIGVLAGGPGLKSHTVDLVLSLFNLTACIGYLYLMLGVVHEASPLIRAGNALVLAAIVGALVPGYRFAIFLFTLYTT